MSDREMGVTLAAISYETERWASIASCEHRCMLAALARGGCKEVVRHLYTKGKPLVQDPIDEAWMYNGKMYRREAVKF